MKKSILPLLTFLLSHLLTSFAQSVPQKFNYQGVARLANGDLIVNTTIRVQFSLIPDASGNAADYVEWHETTTNAFGLFNVQIGGGTATIGTNIGDLEWGTIRYVKIGLDPDGTTNGLNYLDMGVTQLLTVPYAKLAENTVNKEWTTVTDDRVILRPAAPFHTVAIGDSVGTGDQSLLVKGTLDDDDVVFISHPGEGTGIYSASELGVAGEFYGMYGISSTGIIGAGYFSSEDTSSVSTLVVQKPFSQTSSEGNGLEVGMNSGGISNHIMLHELEASDYARISFASGGLGYGTSSDVWTLAGKTDAQTNANSRFHIFRNGTGNVLSATGAGNVGIGNADPTSKLEVAGQVKITGGSPGNGKVLTSDANGLASWQTVSGTGFVLPFDQTYNNSNTTAFIVHNNDGNAISGVSLDGNGVLGQSSTNYGVDGFSSSNVGISGRSQTGTGGRFISQSGPALVTAGGNVGLGTSSPTAQLEVAGQVKITGGSPGANKVLTSDANGLATWQTPSGGGGLTLPYSATAPNSSVNSFEIINPNNSVSTIRGRNQGTDGVGIVGNDESSQSGGKGVYGTSIYGTGGSFLSINGPALTTLSGNVGLGTTSPTAQLEVAGQVKITGGSPGSGKVLTSDANGLASWQTPSGGGGGGQWTTSGTDIYNSNQDNVGIGTTTPYAKLHVEGVGYFNSTTPIGVRIDNSGIGNVALDINATGPAITSEGLFGIDAVGTNTGVIGTSNAQTNGMGVSGIAECATCIALNATSEYGTALYVTKGGVADNGGRWSKRYDVNGTSVAEINIIEAANQNDMVYVQAIGASSLAGAINHSLTWNGSYWALTCPTCPGTFFDDALQFNVMVIHYDN